MNIPATIYPLIDRLYDYITIKRKCSIKLSPDLFDNKLYSIDEFYNSVQPFFDKPELFYTSFTTPLEKDIKKLPGNVNNESFSVYPSPVTTKWNENSKAFFKLFAAGKRSETLLLFAPGWARKDLVAESKFCRQLLKNGIDNCLLVKPISPGKNTD